MLVCVWQWDQLTPFYFDTGVDLASWTPRGVEIWNSQVFFNVCTMRNDKSWDFAQHSGDETIYQAKIFGLNSLLTFSESISLLQEMTRFYLRALPWPPGHPALWELPGEGATQHPECHHSASAVQDDTPTLGNAALLMNTGCGQCAFLIRTVDVHFGLHSNLSGCLT